jgi:hypothetical protein
MILAKPRYRVSWWPRGEDIKEYREFWQAPPVDVAYIHRKLAGLFMLASRLKVSVNVHRLIMPWLQ